MSNVIFKFTPEQWIQFGAYEAKTNILRITDSIVEFECINILPHSSAVNPLLPSFFKEKGGDVGFLKKAIIKIQNPHYIKLRACLRSSNGEFFKDKNDCEIYFEHEWGVEDDVEYKYEVFGDLVWPRSAISDFIIMTTRLMEVSFDPEELKHFP